MKLGPTNNFPRGKIHKDDDGELTAAIGADKERGVVVIQFGSPVTWLALEKDYAINLANMILAKAKELPDG